MTNHKSEDYKITAVKHYLKTNKIQEEICKIFNCYVHSFNEMSQCHNFL